MLVIALYTHVSLYTPSLLYFMKGEYVNTGGDHFFDGLFLSLFHYLNIIVFYVLNVILLVKGIIKKKSEGVLIILAFVLVMLAFHFFIHKPDTLPIVIEEIHREY